jgi:hypothetical protein
MTLATTDMRIARRHLAAVEALAAHDPSYFAGFSRWASGVSAEQALATTRERVAELRRLIHRKIAAEVDPACGHSFGLCGQGRRPEAYRIYVELVRVDPCGPRPLYEISTNIFMKRGIRRDGRARAHDRRLARGGGAPGASPRASRGRRVRERRPAGYLAISLSARALAELVNGVLEDSARSVRATREALERPLTDHPLHELVNGQARRKLPFIERELARRGVRVR